MTKEDVKLLAANGRTSVENELIGQGFPELGNSTSSLLEEAIEGVLTGKFGTECPLCYEKAMDVEPRWFPFSAPQEENLQTSCSECCDSAYEKE